MPIAIETDAANEQHYEVVGQSKLAFMTNSHVFDIFFFREGGLVGQTRKKKTGGKWSLNKKMGESRRKARKDESSTRRKDIGY